MKMTELIKKKDPILIALTISIFILVVIIIFMMYYSNSFGISETVSSSIIGGTIGAIGAIIGGVITFLGVRLTINYEIKKEQLDRYPERIINIDTIFEKLKILDFSHELDYSEDFQDYNIGGVEVDKMRKFLDEEIENLLLNSAKLNRSIYSKMKQLFYKIEETLDSDNSSSSDRDNVMEISDIVKLIEDELEVLENKYNRDIVIDL